MILDDLRERAERYALRQIPTLVSIIQRVVSSADEPEVAAPPAPEQPEVTLIGIEDASQFVQHMQALEGALRLDACEKKGCICKMEIHASVQMTPTGNAFVTVATAHDQFCPSLPFWKDESEPNEGKARHG